jgi:hypothetical protein
LVIFRRIAHQKAKEVNEVKVELEQDLEVALEVEEEEANEGNLERQTTKSNCVCKQVDFTVKQNYL